MATSLYKTLLIEETKRHEKAIKDIYNVIEISDAIKRITTGKRKDDINPQLSRSGTSFYISYRLPKMNAKFVWLTTERIFNALGIDLSTVTENQQPSFIYFTKDIKGTFIDLTFYFKESCVAITETKTETKEVIIGYKCS